MVPFTSCKFPRVVVRGVKIGMYNGGGGHMYTWWIIVISLDAQLPTIGGVYSIVIVPVLSIVFGSPDPSRQSKIIKSQSTTHRLVPKVLVLISWKFIGATNDTGCTLNWLIPLGVTDGCMIVMRPGIWCIFSLCLIEVVNRHVTGPCGSISYIGWSRRSGIPPAHGNFFVTNKAGYIQPKD